MAGASGSKGVEGKKAAKQQQAITLPTCAPCGEVCKADCSNWFEKHLSDEGIWVPDSDLCMLCGSHAEAREMTHTEYVKAMDINKAPKRQQQALKAEREEHVASTMAMADRAFNVSDVIKEVEHGVITGDAIGVEFETDFEKNRRCKLDDTALTSAKVDFPCKRDEVGVLRSDAGAGSSTSTAPGVAGAPPPVGQSTNNAIGRHCNTKICMREVLLDGKEVTSLIP